MIENAQRDLHTHTTVARGTGLKHVILILDTHSLMHAGGGQCFLYPCTSAIVGVGDVSVYR